MQGIFFPSLKPRFVDAKKVINELREIAVNIVKENSKVEAIYLFGSYAHGNASLRSDVDILIVLSEDNRSILNRLDEFILRFCEGPVPADVLVYTRKELDSAIKRGNKFLSNAVEGIRLK